LGNRFQEFKAAADGIALANQGVDGDIPGWDRERETHHFAEGDFVAQHGRDPGLADID